jgi:hypothetical protein
MTQRSFFVRGDDLKAVMSFVFEQREITVYEGYSRYDSELREFRSVEDLEAAYDLSGTSSVLLRLWSQAVSKPPNVRRFELKVPGYSFRYVVEDMGLMQIDVPKQDEDDLRYATFSHWNEPGARERFGLAADAYDWAALRKVSGRIQRHIFNRLASAKLFNCAILKDAYACVGRGKRIFCHGSYYCAGAPELNEMPSNKSLERTREG